MNMISKRAKPYEKLTDVGAYYELSVMEDVPCNGIKEVVIYGKFRGWEYDEAQGLLYAVIWESGKASGEPYYVGDILAVKRTNPSVI